MSKIYLSEIRKDKKSLSKIIYNAKAGSEIFINHDSTESIFSKDNDSCGSTWRKNDFVIFGDELVTYLFKLIK